MVVRVHKADINSNKSRQTTSLFVVAFLVDNALVLTGRILVWVSVLIFQEQLLNQVVVQHAGW